MSVAMETRQGLQIVFVVRVGWEERGGGGSHGWYRVIFPFLRKINAAYFPH